MSRIKPPINVKSLDQTKAFHVVVSETDWPQGVVCGELTKTGNIVHYRYFDCYELRCLECGVTVDASDYDKLYIRVECDFGDSPTD